MYRISVDSLRDLLVAARNDADTPIETLLREAQLTEVPDGDSDIPTPPLSDDDSPSEQSDDETLLPNSGAGDLPDRLMSRVELADFKAQLAIQGSEIGFLYEVIDLDFGYSDQFILRERLNNRPFILRMNDFSEFERETLEQYLFYGNPMKKVRPKCGPDIPQPRRDYDGDPDMTPGQLRAQLRLTYMIRFAKENVVPPGIRELRPEEINLNREGYYTVELRDDGKAYLYHRDKQLISVNQRDLPRLLPKKKRTGVRPSKLRRCESWRAKRQDSINNMRIA